jgi:hypothetical protein
MAEDDLGKIKRSGGGETQNQRRNKREESDTHFGGKRLWSEGTEALWITEIG